MHKDELKSCPFCGGTASLRTFVTESLWSHDQVTYTAVGCKECEIEFSSEPGYEVESPEAWNRRAALSAALSEQTLPVRVKDRAPERPELAKLIVAAKAKIEAMSSEELEAMLAAQRESWVRGEVRLDRKVDQPALVDVPAVESEPARAIPRADNCGRYLAEVNDGKLLYLNHANQWQECPNFIRDALADAKATKGEPVTAVQHNAAFDPADEALGGAFKDGFREGWLFARSPDFEDREEAEEDYPREVDMAPTECWDAYRSHYFAKLPLAAIPQVCTKLYVSPVRSALAPAPAGEDGWMPIETAPKDGTHCILAVQEGAFIYSVQGAFDGKQWNAVHRESVEPLCWMPNVRLPLDFLPPSFRSDSLATLSRKPSDAQTVGDGSTSTASGGGE